MRQDQSDDDRSDTPGSMLLREGRSYLGSEEVPRFGWESRWLRGHEYGLMLRRVHDYAASLNLAIYPLNQHPLEIYQRPVNGALYFMRGDSLQRFGFPRIDRKKRYCWKKMNFITHLPKRDPEIKYIVASSYVAASFSEQPEAQYRMHVACLEEGGEFLLCHIRRVSGEWQGQAAGLQECFEGESPNFYKLFMHLHNNYHLTYK